MLKQLSALILFSTLSFPQNVDSLKFSNNRAGSDSTKVSISDTTSIADTLKKTQTAIKDTLIPIQGAPLTDVSTIINKRIFLFENYRYTGDLLRSFSLYFIKDLGFVGYPSESFIYGVGDNGVSYLQDGVFINNRYTNTLDLNLVQSEDVDSIEIVPSPRGFLYGPYNNPVTVNFITKDFASPQPYSRIKYYQGPDGEAMIDGKFSTLIANKWNYSFQVTNRSKDETFKNTDLSLWQFNTKLKYFLSNSVNLQAYYYYVDKKQGLNDGVDYDSLSKSSDNPNSDLYDPIFAPVVSPNQKLNILHHNVGLRTLAKPFDNSKLDLSIYYRYGFDDLKDSYDSISVNNNIEYKSYGGVLNFIYSYDFLTFRLFGDYGSTDFKFTGFEPGLHDNNFNEQFYNYSGIITLSLLNKIVDLSFYFKNGFKGQSDFSYNGIGSDIRFILTDEFSIYGGYSVRSGVTDENTPTIEGGIKFNKFNLLLDFKYFKTEYIVDYRSLVIPFGDHLYSNEGLGLNLNYKFWLLLLETNTSYYFKIKGDNLSEAGYEPSKSLPDLQFIGGLFVNNLFFENNLDLKAGFRFYYTGTINTTLAYNGTNITVQPTNKLDFTLAGEIKKVAIFYFIWENLFGNQYYITPYYPMPERNIKFGLAWELFN